MITPGLANEEGAGERAASIRFHVNCLDDLESELPDPRPAAPGDELAGSGEVLRALREVTLLI